MKAYNIRIALESNISDARLKKLLGKKYVINVQETKYLLRGCASVDKGFHYSMIIHDRDTTCNKVHLHLVVSFENEHLLGILKQEFPVGYFEECKSYDASLLYLLHRGHADKTQYSVSDLYTNIDYYARFPFLKGVC